MTAVHQLYDRVFLGMGCANALLLRSLHRQGQLKGLRLCIIEPNPKQITHKTFCFWATPKDIENWNLTSLITRFWRKSTAGLRMQSMSPYHYYYVSGEQLFQSTREILSSCDYLWVEEHVLGGSEGVDRVRLQESGADIFGRQFFDSRPPKFDEPKGTEARLLQSFRGWNIQTDAPKFENETCTLMDFDIPQNDHTQFMYVLPFTEKTALVECTRFGKDPLTRDETEKLLGHYIKRKYGNYSVAGEEEGIIPMCTARQVPGVCHPNWVNTGSRAGNIKPSTGYSFINCCLEAERIANGQIRTGKSSRFSFYDRLLLHILERQPNLGKPIFLKLFDNIQMSVVIRFLREETTLVRELPILAALPLRPFLGAAFRDVFDHKMRMYWPVLVLVLFQILVLQLGLPMVSAGILVAGLLLVGLPHGAIDHLLESRRAETPIDPAFIIRYLLLSFVIGIIWWINAWLGLGVFLIYSAWHFGETEYKSSNDAIGLRSLLWGCSILGFLLVTHPAETKSILTEMNVNLPFALHSEWGWGFMVLLLTLNVARGPKPFLGGLYVFLLPYLPLLHAFGLYFIFDHSYKSAMQIGDRLKADYVKLYVKAIPFTLGAVLLGWGFYAFNIWQTEGATGLFFILLSCLSFPHVLAMTRFYRN